jgi:hypothetical protein
MKRLIRSGAVCVEHDDVASYPTRAEALSSSSKPERWCDECWENIADAPTLGVTDVRDGNPDELRVLVVEDMAE